MTRQRICSTAGIIFGLAVSLACQVALAAEPKRVMLLHSFGREFRPWSEYAKTIRSELGRQSRWPLEIADHSLLMAQFRDENADLAFVEYLRALRAGRQGPIAASRLEPRHECHRGNAFGSDSHVESAN